MSGLVTSSSGFDWRIVNFCLSVSVELGISTSTRQVPVGNFSAAASWARWKYPSHLSGPFLADIRNSWVYFSWNLARALAIVSSPVSFSISVGYLSCWTGRIVIFGSVFGSTGWRDASRSWAVTRRYPPDGTTDDMRMRPRRVCLRRLPAPMYRMNLVQNRSKYSSLYCLRRQISGDPTQAVRPWPYCMTTSHGGALPSGILIVFGSGNRAIGVATGFISRSGK